MIPEAKRYKRIHHHKSSRSGFLVQQKTRSMVNAAIATNQARLEYSIRISLFLVAWQNRCSRWVALHFFAFQQHRLCFCTLLFTIQNHETPNDHVFRSANWAAWATEAAGGNSAHLLPLYTHTQPIAQQLTSSMSQNAPGTPVSSVPEPNIQCSSHWDIIFYPINY